MRSVSCFKTIDVLIYTACLYVCARAHVCVCVCSLVPLSGTGKQQKRGGGGDRLHWRVQGSTSSPTGVGSRWRVVWGVMEFGMTRRIKPKRNMCVFRWRLWRNLDSQPKNKELWSYVVSFEFSRPKGSSDRTQQVLSCLPRLPIWALTRGMTTQARLYSNTPSD